MGDAERWRLGWARTAANHRQRRRRNPVLTAEKKKKNKTSGPDAEYQQVRERMTGAKTARYDRGREPPAGRDKVLSIDSSVSL